MPRKLKWKGKVGSAQTYVKFADQNNIPIVNLDSSNKPDFFSINPDEIQSSFIRELLKHEKNVYDPKKFGDSNLKYFPSSPDEDELIMIHTKEHLSIGYYDASKKQKYFIDTGGIHNQKTGEKEDLEILRKHNFKFLIVNSKPIFPLSSILLKGLQADIFENKRTLKNWFYKRWLFRKGLLQQEAIVDKMDLPPEGKNVIRYCAPTAIAIACQYLEAKAQGKTENTLDLEKITQVGGLNVHKSIEEFANLMPDKIERSCSIFSLREEMADEIRVSNVLDKKTVSRNLDIKGAENISEKRKVDPLPEVQI
jgi:hypothetical protein